MPATPFSLSHHQNRFAIPAHHAVFLPRPVAPGSIVIMKLRPQPCGGLPSCGYSSGAGFVCSAFAAGMGFLAKSGIYDRGSA